MDENFIKIEAKCHTVTPMLAAGANQQVLEIRTAEIKSALRFWWRAFWWRAFQKDDPKDFTHREADLFGSTDNACPFRLRIEYHLKKDKMWNPDKEVKDWPNGLEYFLYPIYDGKNKKIKSDNKRGRPVAKPGQDFTLTISFHAPEKNIATVQDVLRSLWLLENLGGIGGRTRRGAGCFEIKTLKFYGTDGGEIQKANHPDKYQEIIKNVPLFFFAENQNPADFIKQGIDAIHKAWGTRNAEPSYTAFCSDKSDLRVVWSGNSGNTAMDIMGEIGLKMKESRNKKPLGEAQAMHKSMADAINNKGTNQPALTTVTKAALGMPIIYNFHKDSSNPHSDMLSYDAKGKNRNATFTLGGGIQDINFKREKVSERRASPLLISCHQKGGKAYAVLCHFPAPLLPPREKLYLQANYEQNKISGLYRVPDHSFATKVLNDIVNGFAPNERQIFKPTPSASATPAAPSAKASTAHGRPSVTSAAKQQTKQTQPAVKDPLAVLRRIQSENLILARLTGTPDTRVNTICQCRRLFIQNDGSLGEEAGWTVKTQDARRLPVNLNDFFLGVENPVCPRRLNDLRKVPW